MLPVPLARPVAPHIRLLALSIDLVAFAIVYIPISLLFIGSSRHGPAWTSAYVGNALALLIGLTEIFVAASPGKLILRLRIMTPGGERAARGTLALRYLLKFSPRLLGLVHAVLLIIAVKQFVAWTGLSFFRDRPIDYVCLPIIGEVLTVVLAGGYALILRPGGRALHDVLTGTQVLRLPGKSARQGFEPVMAEIVVAGSEQAPAGGRMAQLESIRK